MKSYSYSNRHIEAEATPLTAYREDLSSIEYSERLALEVLMARLDDCFVEDDDAELEEL